jgi:hypothetical protein
MSDRKAETSREPRKSDAEHADLEAKENENREAQEKADCEAQDHSDLDAKEKIEAQECPEERLTAEEATADGPSTETQEEPVAEDEDEQVVAADTAVEPTSVASDATAQAVSCVDTRVTNAAATLVQAAWRGFRERQAPVAVSGAQRRHDVTVLWAVCEAAVVIQSSWRRRSGAARALAARSALAVALLQRVGRGISARREVSARDDPFSGSVDAMVLSETSDGGDSSCSSVRPAQPMRRMTMVPVGYRRASSARDFVTRLRSLRHRTDVATATTIQRWWRRLLVAQHEARHQRVLRRLLLLNGQAALVQRWWRLVLRGRARRLERRDLLGASWHVLAAGERGAKRAAMRPDLHRIWATATAGTRVRASSRGDISTLPQIQPRHNASFGQRLNPHQRAGRYAAHTHNDVQIWNEATTTSLPTWYAESR